MAYQTKFQKQFKAKFGYDVTALPAYVDEQKEGFITTLVQDSNFLSRLQLETGVKGTRTLKLLSADLPLQEMSGCTPNPDGTVTFSGKNISTKRLHVGIEFCNEDLNSKWTQLLNKIGATPGKQDQELVIQDVLIAYLGKILQKKAQDIAINGDTGSGNPDLAHFDGFAKLILEDGDVLQSFSTETAITSSNAFDIFKGVYSTIPAEVLDNELNVVLLTGRQEAQAIIDQAYNDKDHNIIPESDITRTGGQIAFTLPTTEITVETIPQLNGTGNVYAFIYDYAFLAVDEESDIDELEAKVDEYNNKLKVEATFRLGVQFVLGEFWVRLRLTPTS